MQVFVYTSFSKSFFIFCYFSQHYRSVCVRYRLGVKQEAREEGDFGYFEKSRRQGKTYKQGNLTWH